MEWIGPYEVLGELGQGGMARVVRARHLGSGAVHALKLLEGPADPELLERFRREAAAVASMPTAHVVPVHAVGVERGRVWLSMDLMPGGTLRERLRAGPVAPEEAASITWRLAEALVPAHANGLVHRDVKPENVLFDAQGRPRLADFGCVRDLRAASLTESGALLGTPGYMAPEQLRGARAGPPADVFALGVILHELLAGHRPFAGTTAMALLEATVTGRRAPVPEAPAPLLALIERALDPVPERRIGAAELADALSGAEPPGRSGVGVLLAGTLLVGVAAGLSVFVRPPASSAPGPAPVASPGTTGIPGRSPTELVQRWLDEGPEAAAPLGDHPDLRALAAAAAVARGEVPDLPPASSVDCQRVLVEAAAVREVLVAFRDPVPGVERLTVLLQGLPDRLKGKRTPLRWRHALARAIPRRLELELLPRRNSVPGWHRDHLFPLVELCNGLPLEASDLPFLKALEIWIDRWGKPLGLDKKKELAELLKRAAATCGDPVLYELMLDRRLEMVDGSHLPGLARVLALEAMPARRAPEEREALVWLRRRCAFHGAQERHGLDVDLLKLGLGGEDPLLDPNDGERYENAVALVTMLRDHSYFEAARAITNWEDLGDPLLPRVRAGAHAVLGEGAVARELLERSDRPLEPIGAQAQEKDRDLRELVQRIAAPPPR